MQNIRTHLLLIVISFLTISCGSNNSSQKAPSTHEKSLEAPIPKLGTELPSTNYNQLDVLVLGKGIIKVGMVSDDFIEIVSTNEIVNQIVDSDPKNPNSLVVRKDCRVENKEFTVILARNPDPGPYRIISILERKNSMGNQTVKLQSIEQHITTNPMNIETLSDFEKCQFYSDYNLSNVDKIKLKGGESDYFYETSSLPDISFEVTTVGNTLSEIGIVFYERDRLQTSELNFVYKLLESLDKINEVEGRIKGYIKSNAEKNVDQIKQANPTIYSKYRIYAGKVGYDQTIRIEKL